jgi:hypothetical protein
VGELLREIRMSARGLGRSPGFTLLVVATLAVGIGANVAIFALVNETLLKPLPFRDPGRLVQVWDRTPEGDPLAMSPPVWAALAARTDVFATTGGSTDVVYDLTGVGEPESIVGYRFSAGFFRTLGVSPALGRVFTLEEDRPGRDRVVVLSHRLWQRKLGGDPGVLGRSLTLSGHPYTIVGVMPPGFVHPPGAELWTPLALPDGARDDGRLRFVRVVARLRPGVPLERARREVEKVSTRLSRERPDAVRGGGLAPALAASVADPGEALKGSARGVAGRRSRLPSLLVGAEVALAVVLLVGAGLLLRTFAHLRAVRLGFERAHVLTGRILPPGYKYGDAKKLLALHDAVLQRVRSLPGVEAAGSVTFLPLSGWHGTRAFRLEGEAPPPPGGEKEAEFRMIDPGYLRAMGIPLRAGRRFDARDRSDAPRVVLVNQSFVRRFLPGVPSADAVGRRVSIEVRRGGGAPLREIVGVVGDVRHFGFELPPEPEMYLPFAQEPVGLFCLAVRTKADPRVLAGAVKAAVGSVDPDQPVAYLMPLEQLAREALSLRRLSALLVGAFAVLALCLAALGVYGVASQAVARRTREIAVRMALGARSSVVVADILWRTLVLAASGALVGGAGSLVVGRLLRSLLRGVTPADPVAFGAAAACLLAAAGVAGYLPARRAARVDPAAVLREA